MKCQKCRAGSYEGKGSRHLLSAQYDKHGKLLNGVCEHGLTVIMRESSERDRAIAAIPLSLISIDYTV